MFKDTPGFSSFSVDDMAKAAEFYGQTLGLNAAPDEHMPNILKIKLAGGGEVIAYPKPNHEAATFTILNFVVPNIDAAVEELAQKGIQFESYQEGPAPTDAKGIARGKAGFGPSIAWFKDPAGNILAVIEAE